MADDEDFGYLDDEGEEFGDDDGGIDIDDDDLFGGGFSDPPASSAQDSADMDLDEYGNPKLRCSLCKSVVPEDCIYVLRACHHRFCRFCISRQIDEMLKTSVTACCPLKDCGVPLSVEDTRVLAKEAEGQRGALAFVAAAEEKRAAKTGGSTKKATQRIAAELKSIQAGHPEKSGFSVELVDDNLYLWEVKLFGFDPKDEQIARDMQAKHIKYIVLHIKFPEDFPLSPPFCRIIRPRFEFHTGHVTLGGSICMELLTRKGWSPENSVEAVIMSIRSNFLEGGARLAANQCGDYSEGEAKEAFDRLVRQHGWY